MAYEDNRSVSEVGAVTKVAGFAAKVAKYIDYARSIPLAYGYAAGATLNTVAYWTIGWIPGVAKYLSNGFSVGERFSDMFAKGWASPVLAGVVGVARGIEAVNEFSKGNSLKAANTVIKGAVEAGVVFAQLSTLGIMSLAIEPLSYLATGKALSTNLGEAAARIAENIEESFIGNSVEKKTKELKQQLADMPVPMQQPIIVQPRMMAQGMQPVMLPSQPVIPNQMMPYVVQQEMATPAGFTPRPTNYWTNYVAGQTVANQNKALVAAVPQEAAAFSHAVAQAERKAASMQALTQQTV